MRSKLAILSSFLSVKNFNDATALHRHQQAALKRRLATHGGRFYPNNTDLADYPIINKAIFMANFDKINRLGITENEALAVALQAENSRDFSPVLHTDSGDITVGLSSGTTGSRGVFLVSAKESAMWAGYILRRMLPKPYLKRHKIAFFLRANSNLYSSVKSLLIQFKFYDLFESLDAHIPALNAQNPSILIAPATVLQQLALRSDVTVTPVKIISVAEVLEPQVQILLEQRFGVVIHQIYQCTEGFLAHTCAHGHLHLNEDMLYIEKDWIDKASGRFCPIVTDFHRETQPVIRYRLDDVLVWDGTPCPCGSAFGRIKAIEGRYDDMLMANGLDGTTRMLYADFIRRALIMNDVIQEYRVTQQGRNLHIQLIPDNPISRRIAADALDKLWRDWQVVPFDYIFEAYQDLPLHQKRRRITRIQA